MTDPCSICAYCNIPAHCDGGKTPCERKQVYTLTAERDSFIEQAVALRDELVLANLKANCLQKRYVAKEQECERLRGALRFYAKKQHYVTTSTGFAAQYDPTPPAVEVDRGERARDALNGGSAHA